MVQSSVVIVALGVGGLRMMSSSTVWAVSECLSQNKLAGKQK